MTFAKLFGEGEEQILVKIDTDEDGNPEVRFYCEPVGLGVSSISISFNGDDNGFEAAKVYFDKINDVLARSVVVPIYDFVA